jgi:hypothetical protein
MQESIALSEVPDVRPLASRVRAVAALALLYALSVALGATAPPGYPNSSGIADLGHRLVPPLLALVDERTAEYVWWLGTLPLELFFVAIVGVVLFTGRGVRLACCLYGMYALHWLCLLATTLPTPDRVVWRFPPGVFTLGHPCPHDLWFSGHVANAFVIALATRGMRPAVRALAWTGVVFETLLVLSTRTHYSIDVIGGLFVAYTAHRLSLDWFDAKGEAASAADGEAA